MSWKGDLRRAGIVSDNGGLEFEDPIRFKDTFMQKTTVTTIETAAIVTMTPTQLLGNLILRDPAGGARADKVPTATDMITAINGCTVGDSFIITIRNTADQAETITVTTNTGATMSGTMTIVQNTTKRFQLVITGVSSPAYTLYSLGARVH